MVNFKLKSDFDFEVSSCIYNK